MEKLIQKYTENLFESLRMDAMKQIPILGEALKSAWLDNKVIYLCGNGGSAGNAIHLANDFLYGAGVNNEKGLKVEALSSNPAVLTCLANDIGYENIFYNLNSKLT